MIRHFLCAAGVFAMVAALSRPAMAQDRPIVVELFTSQGCSSCPPADAFLRELATRPGVLALGFHIDYWDNLGWKDPFSTAAATARQRTYSRQFGGGQVYTPQLVVDGAEEFVGSDRAGVEAKLRSTHPGATAPSSFTPSWDAVTIAAGSGKGTVLLARFVQRRTTAVGAGENAHRSADDANAVTGLTRLGEWDGTPVRYSIAPPSRGEGLAVLVQAEDGRMLGAAAIVAQ